MIGLIGNNHTAMAAPLAAKRTGVTAFGSMMAGAERTSVTGSVSTQRAESQAPLQGDGATDSKDVDFTHMTRSELRKLISSKIKSGELSIDGTEGFVLMMGPSDVEQAGQVDSAQIDFMQSVRDQMAYYKKDGNTAWLSRLETAYGTMQRYQGLTGGISLLG